ncbi:MAG: hypothetical protein PHY62_05420 [Gallionella sp.]|nr:hypothetical protein [Gallionella sp.]
MSAEEEGVENAKTANQTDTEFLTPSGKTTSLAKRANCEHDWQMDGQTMTAVRWTCSKCFKTELR